ncbi:hypothetical protein [Streptomyces sp. 3214.6]|uniref:hypothetical protein n=1 Tax=Streptomyces sp. 3214.6 TaxID=1882757 RepID=UPI0013520963|nr:hypothetical protein [Streptomyces sp. 3214.6]
MRLPTATLITACALSAALLVVGRGGEGQKEPAPGSEVVAPAVEGRVLLTDPFDDTLGHLFADTSDTSDTSDIDPAAPAAPADPTDPAEAEADSGAEGDADPGLDRALEPAGPDVPVVPDDIGPEVVPEVPDPPDGGGLIPDGPDESDVMPG